jgi:hypothetical protein
MISNSINLINKLIFILIYLQVLTIIKLGFSTPLVDVVDSYAIKNENDNKCLIFDQILHNLKGILATLSSSSPERMSSMQLSVSKIDKNHPLTPLFSRCRAEIRVEDYEKNLKYDFFDIFLFKKLLDYFVQNLQHSRTKVNQQTFYVFNFHFCSQKPKYYSVKWNENEARRIQNLRNTLGKHANVINENCMTNNRVVSVLVPPHFYPNNVAVPFEDSNNINDDFEDLKSDNLNDHFDEESIDPPPHPHPSPSLSSSQSSKNDNSSKINYSTSSNSFYLDERYHGLYNLFSKILLILVVIFVLLFMVNFFLKFNATAAGSKKISYLKNFRLCKKFFKKKRKRSINHKNKLLFLPTYQHKTHHQNDEHYINDCNPSSIYLNPLEIFPTNMEESVVLDSVFKSDPVVDIIHTSISNYQRENNNKTTNVYYQQDEEGDERSEHSVTDSEKMRFVDQWLNHIFSLKYFTQKSNSFLVQDSKNMTENRTNININRNNNASSLGAFFNNQLNHSSSFNSYNSKTLRSVQL